MLLWARVIEVRPSIPNFSLSPTDVGYEEGASPTSSPGGKPARPLFMCTVCHKSFTEKRYRTRHYREKHQPGSNCWYHPDCDHKWFRSRSYKYREHLEDEHGLENDDINKILGRPSRRRRRRDKVESYIPPHFSPLPVEHDRKSPVGSQQRPLMFLLLVEGKYARHASPTPPLMPAVAYNTRPVHAEPVISTTEHEYSSGLGPSWSLSEEEFARLVGYLDIRIHNQIWFVLYFSIYDIYIINSTLRFPSILSVSGDSVADPQIPIYTPVAEYYRIRTMSSQPRTDAASTSTDTSSWLGPVGDLEPYRCASPSLITDSLLHRLWTAASYA